MTWPTLSFNLPQGLRKCGAAYVKGYVFVFGGQDLGLHQWSPAIYSAKVGSDGSVGAWQVAGGCKITGYPAVLVHDNYIVVAGHYNGTTSIAYSDVSVWRVNSDGLLTQTHTGGLPAAVGGASICYHNGWVYVFGGYNGSVILNHVYRCRLNADGTMGTWNTMADFPGGRYTGFAAVCGNAVYLLAGYGTGFATQPSNLRGAFSSDGNITNWLPITVNGLGSWITAGGCQLGDTVYLVGGYDAAFNGNKSLVAIHLGPNSSAAKRDLDFGAGAIDIVDLAVVHTGHHLISIGGRTTGNVDIKLAQSLVVPGNLH